MLLFLVEKEETKIKIAVSIMFDLNGNDDDGAREGGGGGMAMHKTSFRKKSREN